MKIKSFDGRWDSVELDAFLALDSISIYIRFITESDYTIRIYYDEITSYTANMQTNEYPHDLWNTNPWPQYQSPLFDQPRPNPGYTNQPNQSPSSTSGINMVGGMSSGGEESTPNNLFNMTQARNFDNDSSFLSRLRRRMFSE